MKLEKGQEMENKGQNKTSDTEKGTDNIPLVGGRGGGRRKEDKNLREIEDNKPTSILG